MTLKSRRYGAQPPSPRVRDEPDPRDTGAA